jgi:hypothetical protein
MNKLDIQTGDVFFTVGVKKEGTKFEYEFLSKEIRQFMIEYANKKGIAYDWIASHTATLMWINGILYIAESVANGFKIREFDKHYDLESDSYLIMREKGGYTDAEKIECVRFAMQLQSESVAYNYLNFVAFPLYIKLNINIFGLFGSAKKANYCYQSTRMIKEHLLPDIWKGNVDLTSFWDIYVPSLLDTVIDHREVVVQQTYKY